MLGELVPTEAEAAPETALEAKAETRVDAEAALSAAAGVGAGTGAGAGDSDIMEIVEIVDTELIALLQVGLVSVTTWLPVQNSSALHHSKRSKKGSEETSPCASSACADVPAMACYLVPGTSFAPNPPAGRNANHGPWREYLGWVVFVQVGPESATGRSTSHNMETDHTRPWTRTHARTHAHRERHAFAGRKML